MNFVFDLDDTICATDQYSEKYILKFFKENKLPYKQINKTVRFAERKFDWDMETAKNWYKKYGDEMMLKFPCKSGAKDFLNRLDAFGHKIFIATARADDWHADPEGITLKWLKKNRIPYTKLFFGRQDKEQICEMVEADCFFDDDVEIVKRVFEFYKTHNKKCQVFLATTDYNKNIEIPNGIKRFESFQELEKMF